MVLYYSDPILLIITEYDEYDILMIIKYKKINFTDSLIKTRKIVFIVCIEFLLKIHSQFIVIEFTVNSFDNWIKCCETVHSESLYRYVII